MNVCIFKFINGSEAIAELISESAGFVTVRRPLLIQVMRGPDGNPALNFMAWSLVADDDRVVFKETALVCSPMPAVQEVADSYVQNVTGLQLPPGATSSRIIQG